MFVVEPSSTRLHAPDGQEKIVAHADNLVKGTRVITLDERLLYVRVALPRRQRRRIYRLGLEVELFR